MVDFNNSDVIATGDPRHGMRFTIRHERHPIAITASGIYVVALCNDGTMWQLMAAGWVQLEPIPQPESKA